MKNKILLVIAVILLIIFIIIRSISPSTSFFEPPSQSIKVKNTSTNEILKLEMEKYIIGVVAGEMPASFELESLKAQAIAARSYAYSKIKKATDIYNLTNDTSSQVYLTEEQMKNKWQNEYEYYYAKVKEAVDSTKDMVLTFNDQIISAYYFAMSNGYTENALTVFNEDKSYLVSVESKEDTSHRNYAVTMKFTKDNICNKLRISCSKLVINKIIRNNTNRVDYITINNQQFKGTIFRKLLGLRSTDFDININGNEVAITTRGYGHGVGMSQYGANLMAKEGKTYDEILAHYYTNSEIKNIHSIK